MAKDKEEIIIKVVREVATNDSTIGKITIDLPNGKTFKALTLERKTYTFNRRVANPRISCCMTPNKFHVSDGYEPEEKPPKKLRVSFMQSNPYCLRLKNNFYPLFCRPCRFDDVSASQISIGSEHVNNYEMATGDEPFKALEKLVKKWTLEGYDFALDISERDTIYLDESYRQLMFAQMMEEELSDDDDEEDYDYIKNDIEENDLDK